MARFASPSHLVMAVNTTVRAGMFSPIANVSVANSACRRALCIEQEATLIVRSNGSTTGPCNERHMLIVKAPG
jgi:hypothetical protein